MNTQQRRGARIALCLTVLALLVAGYAYWAITKPLPSLSPSGVVKLQSPPSRSQLTWPATSQSAVGLADTSILETHGPQTSAPIASAAKLITALTILHNKPLRAGEPGPMITLGPKDVALYQAYIAQHGSVIPVAAGEQISQYQALQAIMLPSANNMADSLAVWAYGSLPGYAEAANKYLATLGLSGTRVGSDASGLNPSTTSTAGDLVKLGKLAMANPVLAQIVGQATASGLPIAGDIKNVNFLLGTSGIVGIKTGNTDEAGGVFVSASRVTIDGRPQTIITAIVGEATLFSAMKSSLALIRSAQANFHPVTIVRAGQAVATYHQPWDAKRLAAVASQDLTATTWSGHQLFATLKLEKVSPNAQVSQIIGKISIDSDQKSVPIQLKTKLTKPSLYWRLTHPF